MKYNTASVGSCLSTTRTAERPCCKETGHNEARGSHSSDTLMCGSATKQSEMHGTVYVFQQAKAEGSLNAQQYRRGWWNNDIDSNISSGQHVRSALSVWGAYYPHVTHPVIESSFPSQGCDGKQLSYSNRC